jgi:hypothetical protein
MPRGLCGNGSEILIDAQRRRFVTPWTAGISESPSQTQTDHANIAIKIVRSGVRLNFFCSKIAADEIRELWGL